MIKLPGSEDVLSVEPDSVPAFIRKHANAKTLSGVVRGLNKELASGDPVARQKAERALEHLGFVRAT